MNRNTPLPISRALAASGRIGSVTCRAGVVAPVLAVVPGAAAGLDTSE